LMLQHRATVRLARAEFSPAADWAGAARLEIQGPAAGVAQVRVEPAAAVLEPVEQAAAGWAAAPGGRGRAAQAGAVALAVAASVVPGLVALGPAAAASWTPASARRDRFGVRAARLARARVVPPVSALSALPWMRERSMRS